MKSIDELERLIWEKINTATQERDTGKISMLNSLATKLETIKSDLDTIEASLTDNVGMIPYDYSQHLKYPPEGTMLRFVYKNKEYTGVAKNNQYFIQDFGFFPSLSRASIQITNTSRNGWRDWHFQLPGDMKWILADDWRNG